MTTWHMRGTHIELCNCDPGCGCNFRGVPSSPEGNCEAFVCEVIEEGRYGDVDLGGSRVAWALWWPGAIHEGGGRGHAFVHCETDEQFAALETIWRGEAGYDYFTIFNSTFGEPNVVERATVELRLEGRTSSFSVGDRAVSEMEPLRNPVSGEVNDVRIVKEHGFIWKDGEIAQSKRLMVDLPEMRFDMSGRHGVVGPFEWSAG